jgi:hypothetical protein
MKVQVVEEIVCGGRMDLPRKGLSINQPRAMPGVFALNNNYPWINTDVPLTVGNDPEFQFWEA